VLGSLALAGAAISLTLGAFEIALRLLGYEPIYAVYSHPEIFWRKDELLGWSHQPNSESTYVGPRPWPVEYETPVRINSLGLRGPEIADLPPEGYRVMVLGDSFVAGFEVPWEQTFEALAESRLTAELGFPMQVINAGVRGYGTDQSYLYYTTKGRQLDPNLVILFYGGNDYADIVTLHRMRRTFGKGALAPATEGALEQVGYPIPDYPLCSEWILDAGFRPRRVDTAFESAMCGVQTRLADRSALFTFFSMRIRQNPAILSFLYSLGSPSGGAETVLLRSLGEGGPDLPKVANVAPGFDLNEAILRALAREVQQSGAELMLAPLPSTFGAGPHGSLPDGVETFALAGDFAQPELHFEHDSHLNARGHDLVARQLAAAIAERIRVRRTDHG
jgi:lysophospholipase L1-like esterase